MSRDWQMHEVDLCRVKLLEWIADSGDDCPFVSSFYGDDETVAGTAYDDLTALAGRGLVENASGMGGLNAGPQD